jgi:hypothetical protein
MRALQGIVRLVVIKCLTAELCNPRISPAMVLVATAALLLAGTTPPVIPRTVTDIRSHFLVTAQAKPALILLAERLVTLAAFLFVFRMPLDQFSRHHQGFNSGCGHRVIQTHGTHHDQHTQQYPVRHKRAHPCIQYKCTA